MCLLLDLKTKFLLMIGIEFCFLFYYVDFLYFKGESLEIFKEMIKSGCILISCQCIDAFSMQKEQT